MICPDGCSWSFKGHLEPNDPRGLDVPCDDPNLIACRVCGREAVARCGTARESKCGPCSSAYKGRVARVAGSGYRGAWSADRTYFITLTAPGSAAHFNPETEELCPCTAVGGTDLAAWNGSLTKRYNRFITELRRAVGDISYFKATEIQRRGALHLHLIVRLPDNVKPTPDWVRWLRKVAIAHGFGHSLDVQGISAKHAGYVAKYVAKAADQRGDVPWAGTKLQRGREVVNRDGELLGYVFPNGDLADDARRRVFSWDPTYRTWTASRCFGESMKAVRAAQSHYQAVLGVLQPGDAAEPAVAFLCPSRPDGPPPAEPDPF